MKNEAKIYNMLCKFDALTSDDKKSIKAMCQEAGIEVKFETGCSQCYADALLLLKAHYGVKSPVWADVPHITASGNYRMNVPPCDWYRSGCGVVRLDLNTPDDIIEQVLEMHPQHFTKITKKTEKK